jgi:hypothetical protein
MLILLLFSYLARTGKLAPVQKAAIKFKYYFKAKNSAFVRVATKNNGLILIKPDVLV